MYMCTHTCARTHTQIYYSGIAVFVFYFIKEHLSKLYGSNDRYSILSK